MTRDASETLEPYRKYLEVVVLKHCQGWTLPRIAQRIGRSVPAVASLLRRGLAELRNRLKSKE